MAFIECQCCADKCRIDLPKEFPHGNHTFRKLDTNLPQWEVKCTGCGGTNFVDVSFNVTGTKSNKSD